VVLAPFLLGGCANFWDEVTSRDFDVAKMFVTPNPLEVLEKSSDGNKRAQALRMLREPAQLGGKPEEQELFVQILTTSATTDRLPLCRFAAIKTLASYKDPRAAEALKRAYESAKPFSTETNAIINQQALAALGHTRTPVARDELIKVARQPPPAPNTTLAERQIIQDERLTAMRALANYNHYEVTEALVAVLKTEKDAAVRDRAHETLVAVTGKKLPPDAKEWEALLHQQPPDGALAQEPKKGFFNLAAWWSK
jgi:HEAT repeat protein